MFLSCFSRSKVPPPPPPSLASLYNNNNNNNNNMGNINEKSKPNSFTKNVQDGFIELFGWMAEDSDDDDNNDNDNNGINNNGYNNKNGYSKSHLPSPKVRKMIHLNESYKVDFSDPKSVLGKGHFAVVYLGYDIRTNGLASLKSTENGSTLDRTRVAVKRISRSITKVQTLVTEVKALCKVSGHPNIVRLYDVFYDDQYVVLILEFLAGGELFSRIVNGGAYSERDASIHIRKITQALQFMHKNGVVHRDLKPENLVLSEARLDSEIKISDFGLSRILKNDGDTMITVCGTKAYSAPEVDFGAKRERRKPKSLYTNKVDTWSLGVILYVILGAYHPFDPYGKDSDSAIWERIVRGEWDFNDKIWTKISVEAKDLICHLICVEPEMRYDTSDILSHPWILRYDQLPKNDLKSLSQRSLRDLNAGNAIGNISSTSATLNSTANTSAVTKSTQANGTIKNNNIAQENQILINSLDDYNSNSYMSIEPLSPNGIQITNNANTNNINLDNQKSKSKKQITTDLSIT